MKFLIDMFPLAAFFAVYAFADIYAATIAVIIACFIQTFGHRFMSGEFEKMHLVTLGLGIVFGGATLALRDPDFIKLKPTIIYLIFAVVFLGSQFAGKQPMVERMVGKALDLPDVMWRRLNLCWVLFFAMLAYANVFVANNFSELTWVNFKTFGDMVLMAAFVVGQIFFLRRYIRTADDDSPDDVTPSSTD